MKKIRLLFLTALWNGWANADRSVGFLKAYSSLNVEGTQEVVEWVDNHQDEFMLIWKGELIPEVEEILYETAMFNYGEIS